MVKRQIIKIDEELCNGCGLCVPACAEGAIRIIEGKARLIADKYCDGLGACLGDCPQGAISFEEREAEAYDEAAVAVHLQSMERAPEPQAHPAVFSGCPSSRTIDFRSDDEEPEIGNTPKLTSQLRQWPIKINLVNPEAPYFEDADLLVAADCSPFAFASLHPDFLKGKSLVIGCPKFEDIASYKDKLQAIVSTNNINSITVLIMEVPCCSGLLFAVRDAVESSGKDVPIDVAVVSLRGEIKAPSGLLAM